MKKMKRVLAASVAAAMVFGMVACSDEAATEGAKTEGGSTEAAQGGAEAPAGAFELDGSWPEETIKIGWVAYDTTAEQHQAIQAYWDYLSEYYNIEIMPSESLSDAEGELNFINDCAAAGCKAIIGYYNEAKEEAAKTAIAQGMYYWGGFGGDEAAYSVVKDEELYLGGYTLGDAEYNAGKSMAETLISQGCEKIVLCSGGASFGVPMFVKRTTGFMETVEAAKAEGKTVEVVKEVQGWPGTDSFTADQTAVLDMDVDAIASTFDVAMWFQPVMNSDKKDSIKLACIGEVSDTYHDFFNSGLVSCIVYDCPEVCFGNAIPMILNAVNGDGAVVKNEDGSAALFPVQRWTITTPEEFNAIYDLHDNGEFAVSAEDVANLVKAYNPDTTSADFFAYYAGLGVDCVNK